MKNKLPITNIDKWNFTTGKPFICDGKTFYESISYLIISKVFAHEKYTHHWRGIVHNNYPLTHREGIEIRWWNINLFDK